jgi:hypothetical protein
MYHERERTAECAVGGNQMKRQPFSPDWGWGLLAGGLLGIGMGMVFMEPELMPPDSRTRWYVGLAAVMASSLVVAARNWLYSKNQPERSIQDPPATP